jgi:small subunit ribosomal protein S6
MAANMRMREYETIYILRPELDDKAAKDAMLAKKDMIDRLGGKNLKVTAMGRRKLAWECQKETRGIYVHHHFLGMPGIVKEFERSLTIDPQVLVRHSVLLKDGVDPSLAKIEEDVLVPPIFKEKREFSDRRGRFNGDRGDDRGDYGRSRGFGMDDEDEDEESPFGDDNLA